MYAMERHTQIGLLVAAAGRVSVSELAERFAVTTETIRRDLAVLESTGLVQRVHGGAVSRDRISTVEPTFAERAVRHGEAKTLIARRALEVIPEGFTGSVYLDAGTTTGAVAEQLIARLAEIGGHADVITNSITFPHALVQEPRVALTLIGGRVRGTTDAAVGASTVHAISQLRPDIAFVGTNAISASFGLSTPDVEEAAVKAAIVRNTRRVVAVADHSKFDRDSLRHFAGLEDLDILVCDQAPTGELAAALAVADVEVWTA